MSDVITFFFNILGGVWTLITSHWIIGVFVLISVINMIISAINMTSKDNGDK